MTMPGFKTVAFRASLATFVGTFLGALLIGAGLAQAGAVRPEPVSISTSGGLDCARGSVRVTQDSADDASYLGCVRFTDAGGSRTALCYARNAAGAVKQCSTSEPGMVSAAETVNPRSYLSFVVNTDGSCDRVIVTNTTFGP
jgi:hypothetical protein